MDIPLESIKVGHKTILRNIFFAFDSYILKQESKTELNKIIDFMKMNPNIKIEISGHTDSIASNTYNKVLSENRAKSVVQYLINHGINKTRLVAKGFGESRPVATNETIAGRAKNRRTEMKILAR
jgi:outer membrane protein OmpA-like peptidoglycan-associated protein